MDEASSAFENPKPVVEHPPDDDETADAFEYRLQVLSKKQAKHFHGSVGNDPILEAVAKQEIQKAYERAECNPGDPCMQMGCIRCTAHMRSQKRCPGTKEHAYEEGAKKKRTEGEGHTRVLSGAEVERGIAKRAESLRNQYNNVYNSVDEQYESKESKETKFKALELTMSSGSVG
jgi:hypothetical protein